MVLGMIGGGMISIHIVSTVIPFHISIRLQQKKQSRVQWLGRVERWTGPLQRSNY